MDFKISLQNELDKRYADMIRGQTREPFRKEPEKPPYKKFEQILSSYHQRLEDERTDFNNALRKIQNDKAALEQELKNVRSRLASNKRVSIEAKENLRGRYSGLEKAIRFFVFLPFIGIPLILLSFLYAEDSSMFLPFLVPGAALCAATYIMLWILNSVWQYKDGGSCWSGVILGYCGWGWLIGVIILLVLRHRNKSKWTQYKQCYKTAIQDIKVDTKREAMLVNKIHRLYGI